MSLEITCLSADPYAGSDKRVLARFEDGDTALDQTPAQTKAMDWLEDLLDATNNVSLLSKLNKIQAESNFDRDPKPFPDKYTMPLCIVNLVLKEYGLEIEENRL